MEFNLNRAIWLNGPVESVSPQHSRRARGVHPIGNGSLKSRLGSVVVDAVDAHSIARFDNNRYYGVGTELFRNSSSQKTGLDGTRLTFAHMPPTVNVADFLFASGGGELFKSDTGGSTSNWGIVAPTTAPTVVVDAELIKQILSFDDDVDTDLDTFLSMSQATDATNKQEGDEAQKLTVAADTLGKGWLDLPGTLDLTVYSSGDVSPDEDFIYMWVRISDTDNLEYLQLTLSIASGGFDGSGDSIDAFSYTVVPGDPGDGVIIGSSSVIDEEIIEADVEARDDTEEGPTGSGTARAISELLAGSMVERLSTKVLPKGANIWTRLRIAKRLFTREGDTELVGVPLDWDTVTGVKITVKSRKSGSVVVHVDDLTLKGGIGTQGTYKHWITAFNSTTGHESNPSASVESKDVLRQSMTLTLPGSHPDPQVDKFRVYRTYGDGAIGFLAATVDVGDATFQDKVADFVGMHESAGDYLQLGRLQFDNTPPNATFEDCVGPWQGRMWWCRDTVTGKKGQLSFSPIGRPEAVEGFINVSLGDTDPTQKAVIWNGNLYCITEDRIVQILGSTSPFTFREFDKIPGTVEPFTVVGSANGIVYQSRQGFILFNGVQFDDRPALPVLPIFRNENVDGVSPIDPGAVAAYGRDGVIISSGADAFMVDLGGNWRELGLAFNAVHYEEDIDQWLASFNGKVHQFEVAGLFNDAGTSIDFLWRSGAVIPPTNQEMTARMLYVVIDTANNPMVPTLIVDSTRHTLPAMTSGTRRRFEIPVERTGHTFQLEIAGPVAGAQIEIFRAWTDDTVGREV